MHYVRSGFRNPSQTFIDKDPHIHASLSLRSNFHLIRICNGPARLVVVKSAFDSVPHTHVYIVNIAKEKISFSDILEHFGTSWRSQKLF